jgi:hypothetical protein
VWASLHCESSWGVNTRSLPGVQVLRVGVASIQESFFVFHPLPVKFARVLLFDELHVDNEYVVTKGVDDLVRYSAIATYNLTDEC